MKRDLSAVILGLDGLPVLTPKAKPDDPDVALTLKEVCLSACVGVTPMDQGMSHDGKMRCWKLAQRLYAGGVQDFDSPDITMLVDRVNAWWTSPVLVGRASDLLNTDYVPPVLL